LIIRRVIAIALFMTMAAPAQAQVPCASCVVFELQHPNALGSETLENLRMAGALVGVRVGTGQLLPADAAVAIIGPPPGETADAALFAARNLVTAVRAERPGVLIAADADQFEAAHVPVGPLRPYVDAVIGARASWRFTERVNLPSVGDLAGLSLTAGVDRVVIPLGDVDEQVLREFASRAGVPIDVNANRALAADEIIARHQAQRRRQDEVVETTIASGTTALMFELPGFVAPVSITADTTVFTRPGQTDIEHRNLLLNGSTIAGGSADAAPALPLIEPERVGTAPLVIALTDAYRYELLGEEAVGGDRTYVIGFAPLTSAPGAEAAAPRSVARGRAWIDAADFSLRRLQVIQAGLRGPIVSSEQVEEFGEFVVAGRPVRLPVETRIFQMYDGAGYRTPIHRTIALPRYDVNPGNFEARLAEAHAASGIMLRETAGGLKYLLKDASGARRVAANAGTRIRAVVMGLFVDPNISEPLPFAGLSYIDLALFGTGAQVSAFFAGIYGEASWSVPSLFGTRWQLDGQAFGMGVRYYDRLFRGGIERYAENIRQRPQHVSMHAVHPLASRMRFRAGYDLDIVQFSAGTTTTRSFRLPSTAIVHGFYGAIEVERGPWSGRVWWNPARRQGWQPWGLPGTFDPGQRGFQRYGINLSRTVTLNPVVATRVESAWMAGSDLDRFSRYSFNSFDNRLHGYPAASVRYDRALVARTVTSVGRKLVRVDGFADLALVRDAGYGNATRGLPGIGAATEVGGPFRTLWSVEFGYGFSARQPDGRVGTQSWRITGYRVF
jgi:hypothetical protein